MISWKIGALFSASNNFISRTPHRMDNLQSMVVDEKSLNKPVDREKVSVAAF